MLDGEPQGHLHLDERVALKWSLLKWECECPNWSHLAQDRPLLNTAVHPWVPQNTELLSCLSLFI
jgi:hypothetical protein